MKRIGISCRIDAVPGREEYRDALDVRMSSLLWDLGYVPIPLCSAITEVSRYLDALNLDGFVLSGGNDVGSAPDRDRLEKGVLDYSNEKGRPVLGVCRGMQFINDYLGGSLIEVSGHVATRHTLIGAWAEKHGFTDVNSYHDKTIAAETLSENLVPLATSSDRHIEAVMHETLPWLGVMWHPEREKKPTQNDLWIIKNHFDAS